MANYFKPCSVEGCKGSADNKAGGRRGWCSSHYRRWKHHGDPLAGGTVRGEVPRYYAEFVLPYEGEECLLWPYGKTTRGYAQMWVDSHSRLALVSRLVCEEENGPPPSGDHDAAHSCGNGHLGCVTKRHLSWKTKIGNAADMIVHGTHLRGERQNGAKLTEDDVRAIRSLQGVILQKEIASQFGVSKQRISAILARKDWAWLQ